MAVLWSVSRGAWEQQGGVRSCFHCLQNWLPSLLLLLLLCVCRAFLQLVSTVIMIAVGAPFALPALLVMMGVFYALYKFFMASVRQAKRLEAVSR